MLRKINTILRNLTPDKRTRGRSRLGSSQGQVAIILILVTAIALIFYAVVLNLGRVAETETVTQIASNVGASLLASQMASYGQKQYKEVLGGEKKICGWTGLALAIIAVVVCIIVLIICFFSQQWWLMYTFWCAVAALVMALVSLALQLAYIQPGISAMWDKMKSETMDTAEAFVENGIQKALESVITDTVQVPDMNDLDTDAIWGYDDEDRTKPKDEISRYAVYYTDRLQEIPKPNTDQFKAFKKGLKEFLEADGDWGLYDPVPKYDECSSADSHPCCNPNDETDTIVLSECNPCCVPDADDRPEYCEKVEAELENNGKTMFDMCRENSPYGTENPVNNSTYAYVYDEYLDDWTNEDQSFRELLGRDDEHRLYYKESDLTVTAQIPHDSGDEGFRGGDSTGYQSDEEFYDSVDEKTGVFPFFHKILDWGVDLDNIDTADYPNECHWCDVGGGSVCPGDQPLEIEQLDLSEADVDRSELLYNTSYCVDGITNNTSGNPPVAVDKVTVLDGILADDEECAQNILENSDKVGFWKKGADRFCTEGDIEDKWPYYQDCDKHTAFTCENKSKDGKKKYDVGCACEGVKKQDPDAVKDWPEDPLDDMVYYLSEFIKLAEYIVKQNNTTMTQNIGTWYSKVAKWIEPKLPKSKTKKEARKDGDCYVCNEEDGDLIIWKNEINKMKERLEAWRDKSYASKTSCTEVWCVPSSNSCEGVTSEEAATFDSNGNGIRGDMEDVAACLDWNISDEENYSDGGSATGNAQKFQACYDYCKNNQMGDRTADLEKEYCVEKLPRSLVPGFDDFEFLEQLPTDKTAFEACDAAGPVVGSPPSVTEVKTCQSACESLPGGGRYDGALKTWEEPTISWRNESYSCQKTRPRWCERPCLPPLPPPPMCIDRYICGTETYWTTCSRSVEYVADAGSCDDQDFFNLLPVASKKAQGSCSDADSGGFLELLNQSIVEAKVQKVKFQHRLDFLSKRSSELDNVINVLSDAEDNFNIFLEGDPDSKKDSPVENLIQLRIAQAENEKDEGKIGVPLDAIYGWKDDPVDQKQDGYWHIVKVEGRIPSKCDGACNIYQNPIDGDPEWPEVDDYKTAWGLKKCYELVNTEGVVKVRVIRWDEDREKSSLRFPNGKKIWDFRYFNPRTDSKTIPGIEKLVEACASQHIGNPVDSNGDALVPEEVGEVEIYSNAFMLNKRPGKDLKESREAYDQCSKMAHQFLRHGVVSETCAQYYFHEGVTEGMSFKFVGCNDF